MMSPEMKATVIICAICAAVIVAIAGFDNWWRVEAGRTAERMMQRGYTANAAECAAWGIKSVRCAFAGHQVEKEPGR